MIYSLLINFYRRDVKYILIPFFCLYSDIFFRTLIYYSYFSEIVSFFINLTA